MGGSTCGTAGNLETDAGSLFYLPAPHSHEAASFQGTPSPALWPADLPFTFWGDTETCWQWKASFSPPVSQPGLHVSFSSGKVTGAPGSIDLRPASLASGLLQLGVRAPT